MNDFHILSICVLNKDVAGAMCVLRDKSEFAVRKILEKLKIRVTAQTGRAFWQHQPCWALNILFVFAGVTELPDKNSPEYAKKEDEVKK